MQNYNLTGRGTSNNFGVEEGANKSKACYAYGSLIDVMSREPGRGTLEPDLAAGETGSRTVSLKTIASYFNFYKLKNEWHFYSVRLVKPDKWNIFTIFVAGVYHRFRNFCLGCGT